MVRHLGANFRTAVSCMPFLADLPVSPLDQPGGKALFTGAFLRGCSFINLGDRFGAPHHGRPTSNLALVGGAFDNAPHQVGGNSAPLLDSASPLSGGRLSRRTEVSGPPWTLRDANKVGPVLTR